MKIFQIMLYTFLFLGILGYLSSALDVAEKPVFEVWKPQGIKDSFSAGESPGWNFLTDNAIGRMILNAYTYITGLISMFTGGIDVIEKLLNGFGVPGELVGIVVGAMFFYVAAAAIKLWKNVDVE